VATAEVWQVILHSYDFAPSGLAESLAAEQFFYFDYVQFAELRKSGTRPGSGATVAERCADVLFCYVTCSHWQWRKHQPRWQPQIAHCRS